MNTPIVSIVIPAYNQAEFLDRAIVSVLTQDYQHVELIVLDDGSVDGTRKLLEQYTGRFYWESQPNMGQARTLNKGWSMAKGKVLSYLAADDFLLPSAVSKSVATLYEHQDVALTYCDYQLVDARSRVLRIKRTPEFSYRDLVLQMVCQPGPGPFFRREAFERAGLWNPTLRQIPDYEYWLRLSLQGKFMRIPEVLAAYRVHDRSQSFGPVNEARAEEIISAVSSYFDQQPLPRDIVEARSEAESNAHLVSARFHLRSGRYAIATRRIVQAWQYDWTACYRPRTWWLIASGLFNRVGYRALGFARRLSRI